MLLFNGLVNGGTFYLSSATKGTIQSDPKQIIGKVVTITGNGEVGYGSDSDDPFGVVTQIEPYSTNSEEMVVTVEWGKTFEGIKHTGDATAGGYLVCDGNGDVKNSVEFSPCICLGTDTPTTTCTIKI